MTDCDGGTMTRLPEDGAWAVEHVRHQLDDDHQASLSLLCAALLELDERITRLESVDTLRDLQEERVTEG